MDLRARLYDPTTGQFTSRDSYAANAPTRLVDPSGHNPVASAFDWLVAAGCAVGGPALAVLAAIAAQHQIQSTVFRMPEGEMRGSLPRRAIHSPSANSNASNQASSRLRDWNFGVEALSLRAG